MPNQKVFLIQALALIWNGKRGWNRQEWSYKGGSFCLLSHGCSSQSICRNYSFGGKPERNRSMGGDRWIGPSSASVGRPVLFRVKGEQIVSGHFVAGTQTETGEIEGKINVLQDDGALDQFFRGHLGESPEIAHENEIGGMMMGKEFRLKPGPKLQNTLSAWPCEPETHDRA